MLKTNGLTSAYVNKAYHLGEGRVLKTRYTEAYLDLDSVSPWGRARAQDYRGQTFDESRKRITLGKGACSRLSVTSSLEI